MRATIDLRLPFSIRRLTPTLGAEISDISLAQGVSDDVFRGIYQAWLRYQLLLFPPQDLSPEQHVKFARQFGELPVHVSQDDDERCPELHRLSNLDAHGNPNGRHPAKSTLAWHTDGSWRRVTGQATIVYGEVITDSGGETHFCDMYGAYERLDAAWKARIAGLRAVHNLDFSRARHGEEPLTEAQRLEAPPVDHPVVRTHPETGRRCLYLGDHAEFIVGMPYGEGRVLIEELNALAIHPDLTYEHRWQPGELIVWDNRCLMHRATPYDPVTQRRVLRRCAALGGVPT
jgi:taurine dioxygenase